MSSNNYKYTHITASEAKNLGDEGNSFWQSRLWAQILLKTHQASDIFWCSCDTNSILIERRHIFRGATGLYILGADSDISDSCVAFIRENIVSSNDLFIQVEPLSTSIDTNSPAPFRRFIESSTALLDLNNVSEDILLASFAEKGRYNIRLAEKRGVTTRWVRANEQKPGTQKTYIELFFDLLDETTKRDRFTHNSRAYYASFVETLESENAGGLLIAEKDGVLHAAGIFAYWGNTGIYYYGASSSDRDVRRDMATYLLQWEAIREAIKRGCTVYDFLGISSDGTGKLAGVTEFKLRFNPEKKKWPHEQIIILAPMRLWVLQCMSKIRKFFIRSRG